MMRIKYYMYQLMTLGFGILVIIGTEPQMIMNQIEFFL